jgi:hypothetical protein
LHLINPTFNTENCALYLNYSAYIYGHYRRNSSAVCSIKSNIISYLWSNFEHGNLYIFDRKTDYYLPFSLIISSISLSTWLAKYP